MGERHWFILRNQVVAAFHDHISHNLLAIAELLNQVAQQGRKVHLWAQQVLLQHDRHDLDRGQRDLKVDVRDELLNEAKEGVRCRLCELLLGRLRADPLH